MKTLAGRLIGKSISDIGLGDPGHGTAICFTDTSAMTVHSRIKANLTDAGNEIVRVEVEGESVSLYLSSRGLISISTDPATNDCIEYFVFRDTDGTYVVENGSS